MKTLNITSLLFTLLVLASLLNAACGAIQEAADKKADAYIAKSEAKNPPATLITKSTYCQLKVVDKESDVTTTYFSEWTDFTSGDRYSKCFAVVTGANTQFDDLISNASMRKKTSRWKDTCVLPTTSDLNEEQGFDVLFDLQARTVAINGVVRTMNCTEDAE